MDEKKEWAKSDSETIEYVRKEIKQIKDSIAEFKKKPEFASETGALEAEVQSLETTLGEMTAPQVTTAEQQQLDQISKGSSDIMKAISTERQTLQGLRTKGLTIPSDIKRRLVVYGNYLLTLQRWLLWVAGFWWLPGWLKSTLRDIARVATDIGNLLIWIANNFC